MDYHLPVRSSLRQVTFVGGLLLQVMLTGVDSLSARYDCQEEQVEGVFVAHIAGEPLLNGGVLSYSIFRIVPNITTMFQLDANSGTLTVGKRLDREAICPQKVTCIVVLDVAIKNNNILSHIVKVEVSVDDVNDNEPRFSDVILRKSLFESIPRGLVLELSPALDLDSPANGLPSYHLEESSAPFRLVVDRNRITNTVGLKLYLTDQLDRERESSYHLKVKAVDSGQPAMTGSIRIEIEVADVNDNSPRFVKSAYEATLASDAPVGSSVVQVVALDPDEGQNGQVRYYLTKRSLSLYGGIFEVNEKTGEVLTKGRLNEPRSRMITSYRLDVVAEDLGENSIPTQTSVRIQMESVNRQAPLITINTLHSSNSSSLVVEIFENNLPMTFIAHVTVDDDDIGPSGQVTCSLDSDDFMLVSMGEKKFKVIARRSFDREEEDLYTLTLKCSDLGIPPLTSQEKLVVRIDDVDDNVPRFLQSEYNCTVVENAKRGALVVRIQAVDLDEGPNGAIEFSLGPDALFGIFRIDSTTGELFTMETLDREKTDSYDFHVIARSSKVKPTTGNEHEVTCFVHVTVLDVNDELPHFENSTYKFEISENENSGTEVGRVKATDLDLPPNDRVVYHLEFAPEDHVTARSFAIDPVLGIVYTRQALDRESASHHTMRVRTIPSDVSNGDGDVTVVFVKVNDVNDNAPVVTFPSAEDDTVYLVRNASGQQNIANISAYDRDSGSNADLKYAIVTGNDHRSYLLDPRNGSLVWKTGNASKFQRTGDCVDVLGISVKDNGLPVSLTSLTRLFVVFDCEEEVEEEEMKKSLSEFSLDRSGPSIFFVAMTMAVTFLLLLLLLLLVLVVARVKCRRRDVQLMRTKNAETTGTNTVYHVTSAGYQGDVLGPVDRGSDDTLSGLMIGTADARVPSSSLELDRYSRENETNEQKKIPTQADEMNESTSGNERDNDSGCVDVSSAV